MSDHTWRHRQVNVENKKRAQRGEKPYPKYKGQGWDQKSQNDGSWKPSGNDEIYEDLERKNPELKGKLTWPKPQIHPDDVAPEDKYKKMMNTLKIAQKLNSARKLVTGIVSGVGAVSSLLKIRP